jgi:hypothetical protein
VYTIPKQVYVIATDGSNIMLHILNSSTIYHHIIRGIYNKAEKFLSNIEADVGNTLTDSGAHSASYPMGTRVISLRVKCLWHEADHSPTSSAEVKNDGTIPPLPHTSSWHCA